MSKLADDRNATMEDRPHDPQEAEAIRETLAEWMEHQARRVASGAYLADLEDGTSGRNPVLDVCYLALQAAGMAYTFAEAYRDEERTDAASELEEEVGAAVRAVLPPEMHDDVFSDAFDAVGDRVAGLEDEPSVNGGGNRATTVEDDPPGDAGAPNGGTVELPRELAERLVRQVGLLQAADCVLVDGLDSGNFSDMEIARLATKEYASRLRGTLRDLEKRLGYEDDAALTGRHLEECKVLRAQKRRELAEELGGTS